MRDARDRELRRQAEAGDAAAARQLLALRRRSGEVDSSLLELLDWAGVGEGASATLDSLPPPQWLDAVAIASPSRAFTAGFLLALARALGLEVPEGSERRLVVRQTKEREWGEGPIPPMRGEVLAPLALGSEADVGRSGPIVPLEVEGLSRSHLRLSADSGGLTAEELGSTHGTRYLSPWQHPPIQREFAVLRSGAPLRLPFGTYFELGRWQVIRVEEDNPGRCLAGLRAALKGATPDVLQGLGIEAMALALTTDARRALVAAAYALCGPTGLPGRVAPLVPIERMRDVLSLFLLEAPPPSESGVSTDSLAWFSWVLPAGWNETRTRLEAEAGVRIAGPESIGADASCFLALSGDGSPEVLRVVRAADLNSASRRILQRTPAQPQPNPVAPPLPDLAQGPNLARVFGQALSSELSLAWRHEELRVPASPLRSWLAQAPRPSVEDKVRVCRDLGLGLLAWTEAGQAVSEASPSRAWVDARGGFWRGLGTGPLAEAFWQPVTSSLANVGGIERDVDWLFSFGHPDCASYGLAATFYLCVTGELPRAPRVPPRLMTQLVKQFALPCPSLREEGHPIPAYLDRLLVDCLQLVKRERPALAELVAGFDRVLG